MTRRQYRFLGLGDDFGGPALESLGGTLLPGSYAFDANHGLRGSDAVLDPAVYTIALDVALTDTSPAGAIDGWQKILDFKDVTTSSGLYWVNAPLNEPTPILGAFVLYDDVDFSAYHGADVGLRDGIVQHVVLTRDAAKQVTCYVDGVLQFTFEDSHDAAVFDTPTLATFFVDDDDAFDGLSSIPVGTTTGIRIYDTVLDGAAVAVEGPQALHRAGYPQWWFLRRALDLPLTWLGRPIAVAETGLRAFVLTVVGATVHLADISLTLAGLIDVGWTGQSLDGISLTLAGLTDVGWTGPALSSVTCAGAALSAVSLEI